MRITLHTLTAGCILAVTSAFAQCPTPQAEEIQLHCTGAKAQDLVAITTDGATINYFFVGFITQPIEPTAELMDGGRYAISQTVNGCTSGSANVVVNLVEAPAEPGGAAAQDFATGAIVRDLDISFVTGNTVKWYIRNDAFEYILIAGNTLLEDGATYYVTQSNGYCESTYHSITVNQILGTVNQAFKNLRLYPNPATNSITVTNSDAISKITVTNLLGQTVINQNINATNANVNIEPLSTGTYILQAHTAKGYAIVKVIKQ